MFKLRKKSAIVKKMVHKIAIVNKIQPYAVWKSLFAFCLCSHFTQRPNISRIGLIFY